MLEIAIPSTVPEHSRCSINGNSVKHRVNNRVLRYKTTVIGIIAYVCEPNRIYSSLLQNVTYIVRLMTMSSTGFPSMKFI